MACRACHILRQPQHLSAISRSVFVSDQGCARVHGGLWGTGSDGLDPKYLSSFTSALFHKGSTLFRLDTVGEEPLDPLILVERYMDVIGLRQAGLHPVVAPLDTAVTVDHLIASFIRANEIVLCFDADTAGKRRAVRAVALLQSVMKTLQCVSVVRLPQTGLDPNEFVWKECVDAPPQLITHRVSGSEKTHLWRCLLGITPFLLKSSYSRPTWGLTLVAGEWTWPVCFTAWCC